jgi:predicted transcriptional regulator
MVEANLISFVARSERRKEILNLLKTERKSQPSIMNQTKMYKAHTSRALKELSEKKLIICENPSDRSFKFYKITRKGIEVLKEINQLRS